MGGVSDSGTRDGRTAGATGVARWLKSHSKRASIPSDTSLNISTPKNSSTYPDAENFDEYQYAKNFLNDPKTLEGMERSLAEMIVYLCETLRPQESLPSFLIADSRETKGAWDGLNLVAQDLLRKGRPLPPDLAGWIADVLADQLVKKKGPKRRPRPGKGPHSEFNQNLLLCTLIEPAGMSVRLEGDAE